MIGDKNLHFNFSFYSRVKTLLTHCFREPGDPCVKPMGIWESRRQRVKRLNELINLCHGYPSSPMHISSLSNAQSFFPVFEKKLTLNATVQQDFKNRVCAVRYLHRWVQGKVPSFPRYRKTENIHGIWEENRKHRISRETWLMTKISKYWKYSKNALPYWPA